MALCIIAVITLVTLFAIVITRGAFRHLEKGTLNDTLMNRLLVHSYVFLNNYPLYMLPWKPTNCWYTIGCL